MKKKLTLDIEKLAVDPFEVEAPAAEARGTVYGLATTAWYTAPCLYCPNMPATARC